ncbi:uncharacterized protein LOC131677723 [Topomyia yanbarensis]|uniref:uncharacterized protein LOC131677723 n=1 Tax=Topomyia yanbarensis TaxID=2498891 RepID=UPI00273C91A6|nr:uncharacterized protein LOC131677723 [Topomyia yanbarensis]
MAVHNDDTSGDHTFTNTTSEYRSTTSESTILPYYELRLPSHVLKKSPSKIEFHLVQNHHRHKRPCGLRKNIYTRSRCAGDCASSRATKEPPNPKIRKSLKRVFFNFNRKPCSVVDSSCLTTTELQDDDDNQQIENMEIYYFDHGSPEFYRTTDCPPHLVTEALAQSTYHHATKFWAEIFGTLNIGATFVISFWLQLYRFLLYGLVRPVLVGILQITADYMFKPLLAVIFNGLIQPPLVFVQNILTAFGGMLDPVAKLIANFLSPIGRIVQSFRLIESKTINKKIIKKRKFDV